MYHQPSRNHQNKLLIIIILQVLIIRTDPNDRQVFTEALDDSYGYCKTVIFLSAKMYTCAYYLFLKKIVLKIITIKKFTQVIIICFIQIGFEITINNTRNQVCKKINILPTFAIRVIIIIYSYFMHRYMIIIYKFISGVGVRVYEFVLYPVKLLFESCLRENYVHMRSDGENGRPSKPAINWLSPR